MYERKETYIHTDSQVSAAFMLLVSTVGKNNLLACTFVCRGLAV